MAPKVRRLLVDLDRLDVPPVRNGMRIESDVDLFVVRPDAVDLDDEPWRTQLDELAASVATWTGNDAQILEYSAGEVARGVRSKGERVLRDIAAKGIPVFNSERYLQRAKTAQ